MSIGAARSLLHRAKRLERARGATDGMIEWVEASFTDAIAQGRMCPVDGPIIQHCVLKWLSEGMSRSGGAGWALQ